MVKYVYFYELIELQNTKNPANVLVFESELLESSSSVCGSLL